MRLGRKEPQTKKNEELQKKSNCLCFCFTLGSTLDPLSSLFSFSLRGLRLLVVLYLFFVVALFFVLLSFLVFLFWLSISSFVLLFFSRVLKPGKLGAFCSFFLLRGPDESAFHIRERGRDQSARRKRTRGEASGKREREVDGVEVEAEFFFFFLSRSRRLSSAHNSFLHFLEKAFLALAQPFFSPSFPFYLSPPASPDMDPDKVGRDETAKPTTSVRGREKRIAFQCSEASKKNGPFSFARSLLDTSLSGHRFDTTASSTPSGAAVAENERASERARALLCACEKDE